MMLRIVLYGVSKRSKNAIKPYGLHHKQPPMLCAGRLLSVSQKPHEAKAANIKKGALENGKNNE